MSESLARLSSFEVRLYELVTKSHLRIGTGEGAADISAVDNPIIRALVYKDSEEQRVPYLPGSSLHGVIRAWVEKALRSAESPVDSAQLEVAMTANSRLQEEVRKELAAFYGWDEQARNSKAVPELVELFQVFPSICNPLSPVDQCERIYERDLESRGWKLEYWTAIDRHPPCHTCDIFGYVGQRGRVKISNAFPSADIGPNVPVDVITRVAINRLTGAADEGKLFDLEAIPPGVTFYFFVVMENMTDTQKANFDKGVRALNMQMAGLGAHSTIGFGMVDIRRVYKASIANGIFDEALEDTLPALVDAPEFELAIPLDREKYPRFFLALSAANEEGRTVPGISEHLA